MKRIRITFNTKPKLPHALTHEILVPNDIELDFREDFIRDKLNHELTDVMTQDLEHVKVDQILLMVDLENFGTIE
ncbi:hypothetical protein [Hydrotalea sp. AMD]|uniref:hypothetical protein n=1 Tax=Hydrotalea sp. AMD TaxID=2501297 RepID=UPI00257AD09D|nr:hypothetical protein [Hydrotalea sp. AMD]